MQVLQHRGWPQSFNFLLANEEFGNASLQWMIEPLALIWTYNDFALFWTHNDIEGQLVMEARDSIRYMRKEMRNDDRWLSMGTTRFLYIRLIHNWKTF
jgi:hypothetical protein